MILFIIPIKLNFSFLHILSFPFIKYYLLLLQLINLFVFEVFFDYLFIIVIIKVITKIELMFFVFIFIMKIKIIIMLIEKFKKKIN
jgi:hypothetical protein